MVYGRYNYSIHGVYKPTNITGGHHPVSPNGKFSDQNSDQPDVFSFLYQSFG